MVFKPLSSLLSRPCLSSIRKTTCQCLGGVRKSACQCSTPLSRQYFVPTSVESAARYQHGLQHHHEEMVQRIRVAMRTKSEMKSAWPKYVLKIGLSGFGLGLTFLAAPVLYCDPVTSKTAPPPPTTLPPTEGAAAPVPSTPPPPPPPSSSVNLYELTFGTVCGVCAGVFVKKGVKAAAFVLGGVFVLLQYLGSLSLVRVNWSSAATRFENVFYSKDATGAKRPPNVGSLFRWIVDFLTADFQGRASFVAGFTLGLRIG